MIPSIGSKELVATLPLHLGVGAGDVVAYPELAYPTYEVGVVRNPNGPGFVLLFDFWGGGYGLEKVVGKDLGKLRQAYSAAYNIKRLRQRGYTIVREQVGAKQVIRAIARQ